MLVSLVMVRLRFVERGGRLDGSAHHRLRRVSL